MNAVKHDYYLQKLDELYQKALQQQGLFIYQPILKFLQNQYDQMNLEKIYVHKVENLDLELYPNQALEYFYMAVQFLVLQMYQLYFFNIFSFILEFDLHLNVFSQILQDLLLQKRPLHVQQLPQINKLLDHEQYLLLMFFQYLIKNIILRASYQVGAILYLIQLDGLYPVQVSPIQFVIYFTAVYKSFFVILSTIYASIINERSEQTKTLPTGLIGLHKKVQVITYCFVEGSLPGQSGYNPALCNNKFLIVVFYLPLTLYYGINLETRSSTSKIFDSQSFCIQLKVPTILLSEAISYIVSTSAGCQYISCLYVKFPQAFVNITYFELATDKTMLGVVLFDIAYSAILSRLVQSYCNVFEIRAVIKIMRKICFV